MLVTVMHTFPFVYLLASSALQSVDASYEEAAQILGASKSAHAPFSITAPLVRACDLSGTLLAFVNALALVRLAGDHRPAGPHLHAADANYALFDYPPEYGLASALSLVLVPHHRGRALSPARLPGATLLCDARRQGLAAAADRNSVPSAGCVLGFVILIFIVSIVAPYATLIAVSFSKSWDSNSGRGSTLANYIFILFEYNVTQRAILNRLILATRRRHHCRECSAR